MSVKQSECVSYSIRAAVAIALGTAALLASAPRASAADEAAPSATTAPPPLLEEVTVTGSRIKRKDLESSSPLITIDSEQITQRAGLNLESYLNTLPNYNPAQTPTTTQFDVQPSAVNTVGISTISLRGFGPNRSLVLVDGHRTTPVNALMVTDINGIPAAMIDRIEIISGGASAVYGADAIGGVTNFILKKNFEGVQIDVQDSITQAGDGNEMNVSALMGTKVAEGKGNLIMGLEYYNRNSAAQKNRDFYKNAWTDPNAPQMASNALFVQQSGYAPGVLSTPSQGALQALWPGRTVAPNGAGVCGVGGYTLSNFYFNPNGTLWSNLGPIGSSNYTGPTDGTNGFALQNALDGTVANPGTGPATVNTLKWNNPLALISEPQTRYSFFANGTYDLTDRVQFYTNARYAQSRTATLLPTATTSIFGWEAAVPFSAATDSPINPALVNNTTTAAALSAIASSFQTNNSSSNPNWNPTFVAPNGKGAQHPVPWQLAMMLLSRGPVNGVPATVGVPGLGGTFFGGPATCNNSISPSLCSAAPTSWILNYLPIFSALQRSTVDTTDVWQIETGIKFPVIADWTGDLYYSRGESQNYELGNGNDSLQRFRAVIDSPNYGGGNSFQGNANGASTNFGTSVPTHCTSGFYNTLFAGDQTASADCMSAISAPLQTLTAMQQDIVEANFQGTLFKLPAGDVSAAVGYQYRRDAGQFTPDNLQSTYSFLDQTIGLYPLGTLNNEISSRDGYLELLVPVLSDLKMLKKLDLDLGGRYSAFSNNIPSATTFKVNVDASITNSFRIRGGFNRATRAPNLGELYLGEQEYFGGGAQFGDPCSVRSPAPFGAGGAAPDFSATGGSPTGAPTKLAAGQTAAGAQSTYLICQAMMGAAGAAYYYTNPVTNQGMNAAPAVFAWLNEGGNPGCNPSLPERGSQPDHRRWHHDTVDLHEPGHDRHRRCRSAAQLVRATLGPGIEAAGRPAVQLTGYPPDVLQDEAVPDRLRRRHQLEGLAGAEPGGHQRRCVRLPPERDARLCPAVVHVQSALAVPAVGQHRQPRRATGDHQERRAGRCRRGRHAARLHPQHGCRRAALASRRHVLYLEPEPDSPDPRRHQQSAQQGPTGQRYSLRLRCDPGLPGRHEPVRGLRRRAGLPEPDRL